VTIWTHEQFESMSWHDNHVHGLSVVAGEHGAGELLLDLDYIVEWLPETDARCRFRIVPAVLRFLQVADLRIALDYAAATAALGPFSLHAIERRTDVRERYTAQLWTLRIDWPVGEISFAATGYEQRSTGPEVVTDCQCLRPDQRGNSEPPSVEAATMR
jgi:hypothetical protein